MTKVSWFFAFFVVFTVTFVLITKLMEPSKIEEIHIVDKEGDIYTCSAEVVQVEGDTQYQIKKCWK